MPVTATLNESLGTLPSGRVMAFTDQQMSDAIRVQCKTAAEADRKKHMAMRLDLYRDRGQAHFDNMIRDVFRNSKVMEWRLKFVNYAQFQNLTKRVIREISTVYSESAARRLGGKKDTAYEQLQLELDMDMCMGLLNEMGNLVNNCLVWPDVNPIGDPTLRVVTQDKFHAIAHPNDPSLPVGFVLEQFPLYKSAKATDPHYLVVDGATFFRLDKSWRMIEGSRYAHNVGQLPALLYSKGKIDSGILDADGGRDLVSAHLAITLLNVLMLKHQKSGTKQPVASGDLGTTAIDQPMDEEHLLQIGEGVVLSTLDLGADPANYINSARAVVKQLAANYGIPESVFDLSYQATSGFEIELKRVGLREVRRAQIKILRKFESKLAGVMAAVLAAASHPLAFSPVGWSINFGDVETPQDPEARLAYWEKLEGMDLANRVEMYMDMNPEATEEEAAAAIEANEQMRLDRMVRFQAKNGGLKPPGDAGPPDGDQGPDEEGMEHEGGEEPRKAMLQ